MTAIGRGRGKGGGGRGEGGPDVRREKGEQHMRPWNLPKAEREPGAPAGVNRSGGRAKGGRGDLVSLGGDGGSGHTTGGRECAASPGGGRPPAGI